MIPLNVKSPDDRKETTIEKIILAENQPQYVPVPALYDRENATYWVWFKPTDEELKHLLAGGAIQYCVFGPYPPMMLDVTPADQIPPLEPVN